VARIAGVDIPDNKRLFVGLTYIYGVGRTLAIKACEAVGIDPMKKLSELTDEELARLRDYIERNYKVEGHTEPLSDIGGAFPLTGSVDAEGQTRLGNQ